MTVYKIFWLVFVHQCAEAGKSLVGKIISVIYSKGRRMSQKNIESPAAEKLKAQPVDTVLHFLSVYWLLPGL